MCDNSSIIALRKIRRCAMSLQANQLPDQSTTQQNRLHIEQYQCSPNAFRLVISLW